MVPIRFSICQPSLNQMNFLFSLSVELSVLVSWNGRAHKVTIMLLVLHILVTVFETFWEIFVKMFGMLIDASFRKTKEEYLSGNQWNDREVIRVWKAWVHLRSIVLECHGVGAGGQMPLLTRGQKQSQEDQWWKSNCLCPQLNTESYILWLLFYHIAFVCWDGFLNNTIC